MSKEEKVVVEMTKAQKDKVVALLSQEEKKVSNASLTPRTIGLTFQHRRNGERFGPGTVEVPGELAGTLEAADRRALEARLAENMSKEQLVEILGQGVSRVVKAIR